MFQQSRYGPGSSPQPNGNVSKMNGPYQGTKKPRGGDVDRECRFSQCIYRVHRIDQVLQSTASPAHVWRTFKARSLVYVRTSMAAGICRRSSRRAFQSIAT